MNNGFSARQSEFAFTGNNSDIRDCGYTRGQVEYKPVKLSDGPSTNLKIRAERLRQALGLLPVLSGDTGYLTQYGNTRTRAPFITRYGSHGAEAIALIKQDRVKQNRQNIQQLVSNGLQDLVQAHVVLHPSVNTDTMGDELFTGFVDEYSGSDKAKAREKYDRLLREQLDDVLN